MCIRDRLFDAPKFEHDYPHCWRCDTPLIYYARESWFIKMTAVKDCLLYTSLRGTDEVEVPVVNGEYCQTALIGHAIMDADIFISLSPVSYTHLDVYKRQALTCLYTLQSCNSGVIFTAFTHHRAHTLPGSLSAFPCSYSCLLYTSIPAR